MSKKGGSKKRVSYKKDIKVLDNFVKTNKEENPVYKASLKVLGRYFYSQGNTIDEVLDNFKTEAWLKGAGVLSVEKDGVIKEKIIAGGHIRNIFGMASGTLRDVSLKWVRSLF